MNNNKTWYVLIGLVLIVVILGAIFWPKISNSNLIDNTIVEEIPLVNDTNSNDSKTQTKTKQEMEESKEESKKDQEMMDDKKMTTLTSVSDIMNSEQNLDTLKNSTVDLDKILVQSVPSDKVFFVGTQEQNIPVLIDEDLSPNSTTEGQVKILTGQEVSFTGELKEVPSQSEILDYLGITQGDANALLGNKMYIFVQGKDIEIISQPDQ